jgi:hypothetical protein
LWIFVLGFLLTTEDTEDTEVFIMKPSKLGGYEYMWLSKLSRYNFISQVSRWGSDPERDNPERDRSLRIFVLGS